MKLYAHKALLNARADVEEDVWRFDELWLDAKTAASTAGNQAEYLPLSGRVDAAFIGIPAELIRLLIAANFKRHKCHFVDCDPCPPSCFM